MPLRTFYRSFFDGTLITGRKMGRKEYGANHVAQRLLEFTALVSRASNATVSQKGFT